MRKRRSLKKIYPILLTVCMMALAFMPTLARETNAAEEYDYDTTGARQGTYTFEYKNVPEEELSGLENDFKFPNAISTVDELRAFASNGSSDESNGYHLESDITIDSTLTFSTNGNYYLDLNGYNITLTLAEGKTGAVIRTEYSSGSLNLFDTKGSGMISGGNDIYCGGVWNDDGMFNMYGGTISNNSGGGVCNNNNAAGINMYGGTISNNNGSGVYTRSATFNLYEGTISYNTVGSGGSGGGVNSYNAGTTVPEIIMYGGTINNNTASYGAGVKNGGTFIMNGGTITENIAIESSGNNTSGGGVDNGQASTFIMNDGTISKNESARYGGGMRSCGKFTMKGGSITENIAEYGGGVTNATYGTATTVVMNIEGGTISGNTATKNGGGIRIDKGTLTITGGDITGNSGAAAGGVYANSNVTFNISGIPKISGNTLLGSTTESDVSLPSGKAITLTDALEEGAKIGVHFENDGTGVVTDGFKDYHSADPESDMNEYFSLNVVGEDNGKIYNKINDDGEVEICTHEHQWIGQQDGDTVTVTCNNLSDCKYHETGWKFDFNIDEVNPYSGAEITLDETNDSDTYISSLFANSVKVVYQSVEGSPNGYAESENVPTAEGSYEAVVKCEGKNVASKTFVITPSIADQDGDGKPETDDDGDGVFDGTDSDNTYIPDQDGDGKPEVDDDGDGVFDGTDSDNTYIPDQDGDGKPEVDDDGDGVYEGTKEDNTDTYIPDQDGDGKPETDDDGDGVFDGTDSDNTYIPDQDGDGKPEVDNDGDGVYEGTADDKTYIPDQDGDGKPEVDTDGDGVYEGTADDKTYIPDQDGDGKPEVDDDGDGVFEGSKDGNNDGKPDNTYILDQDGDGKPEADDNGDGVYEGTADDKTYIPDQDGDGKPEVDNDGDGVYEGTKEGNTDTYIPDQDGDGKPEVDDDGDGVFEGSKDEDNNGKPDNTYIPDQDGDGKPEVDDDGDGVYDGTKDENKDGKSDNTYIPDQDGDGRPEVDDNGDGIYDGTAGDGEYIPVDTDEDGKADDIVQVTDDNGDGIYEDNDGNRYIPDQDGDGFAESDTDGDGVFDGTKKDGDGKNKEYIPADTDADGTVDEFIEVKPNEDGVYEDDANDDSVFGGEGDNAYVPVDDDADGDVDRYIPKDEFDKDKDKYVPIDKDGDGDIDHYVPEEAFEKEKDDYTPIDKDNDGDVDNYIPDDTFDKIKDDYEGKDTDDDGNNEHYVPKDAVPADGHTHVAERAATCTDKALCGECDKFYGEPLGHDWGAWESISGTVHQSKCINDPEHVKTGEHSPELCCGDKSKQCEECGATGENNHTFTDKWQSNNRADTHWHGCENCGEKQPESEEYHDYPNKNVSKDVPQICSICNYGGHITEVHPEDFTDDDIPEALRGKYKTVSDIGGAMEKVARENDQRVDGTLLFDAVLKYSADGGINWYRASEEHFPKKVDGTYDKLPVKIEVPKETSIDTHHYRVVHMFSQTSEKFGTIAGETEMPDVIEERGADGKEYISFYVTGLSPIMVAWEEEATPLNTASSTSSTGDIPIDEDGNIPIDEDGNIPIDDNNDNKIDHYITEDEFNKNKEKYVPIDKDGDGKIDHYVPKDKFDKDKYVPIDKDGDGKIDYYVPKGSFDDSKYHHIDKDGDGKADYYIPNGVLTDPDGDGIYTPDGKKGPNYEGIDLDGDGIIDMYVLLTEGDGVDSGDDSDMILWLMLLMISITAAGIVVVSRRRIRG